MTKLQKLAALLHIQKLHLAKNAWDTINKSNIKTSLIIANNNLNNYITYLHMYI